MLFMSPQLQPVFEHPSFSPALPTRFASTALDLLAFARSSSVFIHPTSVAFAPGLHPASLLSHLGSAAFSFFLVPAFLVLVSCPRLGSVHDILVVACPTGTQVGGWFIAVFLSRFSSLFFSLLLPSFLSFPARLWLRALLIQFRHDLSSSRSQVAA
jgi:hypothetical protein